MYFFLLTLFFPIVLSCGRLRSNCNVSKVCCAGLTCFQNKACVHDDDISSIQFILKAQGIPSLNMRSNSK